MSGEQEIVAAIEQQTTLLLEALERFAEMFSPSKTVALRDDEGRLTGIEVYDRHRPKIIQRDDEGTIVANPLTDDQIEHKRRMLQAKHDVETRYLERKGELIRAHHARLRAIRARATAGRSE